MEPQHSQKLKQNISKDSIFKVRRVHKVNPDNKYHRPNFQAKDQNHTQQQLLTPKINCQFPKKTADYHYQISIVSSQAYKQLNRKYQKLKERTMEQKATMQKEIIEKQQELQKYRLQRIRLNSQYEKLLERKNQILRKIHYLRQKREQPQPRQFNILTDIQNNFMNLEQLRDMMLSIRYQNGLDIDPDNMTYEQLLQLGQKIGSVNKGFTLEEIQKLPVISYQQTQQNEVCSICYCDLKNQQQINKLDCKHSFHIDCIKDWLLKERICPMCKQQIFIDKIETQKSNNTIQSQEIQQINTNQDIEQKQSQ